MINALKEKILKFLPKIGYYISSDSVYDEKQKAKLSDLLNNKDDNSDDSKQHIRINGEDITPDNFSGSITFIKLSISSEDFNTLVYPLDGTFNAVIDVYVDNAFILSANPNDTYIDKGVFNNGFDVYAYLVHSPIIYTDATSGDVNDTVDSRYLLVSSKELYIIYCINQTTPLYCAIYENGLIVRIPLLKIDFSQRVYTLGEVVNITHPTIFSKYALVDNKQFDVNFKISSIDNTITY